MNKAKMEKLEDLEPFFNNSRRHPENQVKALANSIDEFGFAGEIIVRGNTIAKGHGCVEALKLLVQQGKKIYPIPGHKGGAKPFPPGKVPVMDATGWSDQQLEAYVHVDNRVFELGITDVESLREGVRRLQLNEFDLSGLGFDSLTLDALFAEKQKNSESKQRLSEKFMIAPFTVMNAREGWWQNRKRDWISLGIESEEGRGDNLLKFSDQAKLSKKVTKSTSCSTDWMRRGAAGEDGKEKTGTSIFDPVLCELSYSWFCPKGGMVLDPFAGGSVRGLVAAWLGRRYTGIDLRKEQVDANKKQLAILEDDMPAPEWIAGDSRNIQALTKKKPFADMVFSCPPYANLEVYSDDPADLSVLEYPEFRKAYFDIIKSTCELLKEDRFAAFVVGDVRDKDGNYLNFVADTIQAFLDAGLKLYNEAILVTAIGSLPIRVGKQFSTSRKLGKTHQNILVFVKGSGKKAAEACGDVEIAAALKADDGDPASEFGEVL